MDEWEDILYYIILYYIIYWGCRLPVYDDDDDECITCRDAMSLCFTMVCGLLFFRFFYDHWFCVSAEYTALYYVRLSQGHPAGNM